MPRSEVSSTPEKPQQEDRCAGPAGPGEHPGGDPAAPILVKRRRDDGADEERQADQDGEDPFRCAVHLRLGLGGVAETELPAERPVHVESDEHCDPHERTLSHLSQ